MTIKIKAPVIWLEEADLRGFLSKRCSVSENKYRIVRESDWRKLMKLVRAVEGYCDGRYLLNDVYDALEALQEKKK